MTPRFATLALPLVSAVIAVGRIQAQTTADSVRVQVEAALALLEARDSPGTIRLDPRSELRASVLATLTFEALGEAGFQVYEDPGIPGPGIGLLSSGIFRSSERGSELWMRITYFGSRSGFLNTYSYRYIFRVTCGDDACLLGEQLTRIHGDGHVSGDCWDDFFIRTVTERKECSGAGVPGTDGTTSFGMTRSQGTAVTS